MASDTTRSRLPGLRIIAPVLMLGIVALGGWWVLRTSNSGVPAECRATAAAAQRLGPLARGEVAALSVAERPKPVPEIMFNGPDGQPMTLHNLRGRTVLVNLWATWCIPCRQEMPALDRLQAELGGQDFAIVAINVDTRNPDKPKAWLQENGISHLGYYADPHGKVLQVLQRSGHVVGLPTTILVDPQGCEIAVLKGPAEWASVDALGFLRAALGRS